jgi:hypothetical protein
MGKKGLPEIQLLASMPRKNSGCINFFTIFSSLPIDDILLEYFTLQMVMLLLLTEFVELRHYFEKFAYV